MSGEILIRPKRGQAYLAVATGPDAGAFLFEVWSHLLVGGTLSIGGLAALLILFLAPRERLAKVLVHVGRMSPTAGSPRVPAWLVVVALIALPSLFIYIA
ncbi:MAG: hypothetical protein EON54_25780 [Alcaligenaceae bacterium]|nr:MAG: hypothetical protein EON54_25780 [Alcaligenaceae bacterium]